MPAYDSLSKIGRRGHVFAVADSVGKGKVIYLDDASAGMTRLFVKHWSLEECRRRLVVVNWDAAACRAIRAKTGVEAVCDDIGNVLREHRDGRACLVWIDGEARSIDEEVVRASFRVAPVVELTLTTSRGDPKRVVEDATASVQKCGGRVASVQRFKGKSGVTNMCHLSAYLADASSKAVTGGKVKKSYIGRKVYVPTSLWTANGRREMRRLGVREANSGFVFRVASTYYSSYAVTAVGAKSVGKEKEKWTLTQEQVKAYSR